MRGLTTLAAFALALVAAASATAAADAPAKPGKRAPAGMPSRPDGGAVRSLAVRSGPVVVAVDGTPAADRVLNRVGAEPLLERAGLWMLRGPAGSVVAELSRLGALRSASDANARLSSSVARWAGEPLAVQQWWLSPLAVAGLVPPGPGVPLTIIDSGLDVSHPDFQGRPNTVLLNAQAGFDNPHGTAVASVAAAQLNGVGIAGLYPNALLKVWDNGDRTCAEVVAGFNAVTRAEVNEFGVINLSGGFSSAAACPALYDAVAFAFGRGFLVVAAAGNDRELGSPATFPAEFPHVITVAASDAADRVSGFSTQSLGVDLAAPGQDMPVAVPTAFDAEHWMLADGTSFAAPLVSAAAAWAWTVRGGPRAADHTQMFELLRTGTRDVGAAGWDPDTGFGVLHLPTLLEAALPAPDNSEPNDDVGQVKARGLFSAAAPPLLKKGAPRASVRAFLDLTEDPVDVYRVWLPAKRSLVLALNPSSDVDLEVFRTNARTVYYTNRGAALRGTLFGGSYRSGAAAERYTVRNRGRAGSFVYVVAYKSMQDSTGSLDASYTLAARLTR